MKKSGLLLFCVLTLLVCLWAVGYAQEDEATPAPDEQTPAGEATPMPVPSAIKKEIVVPDPELRRQIHAGLIQTKRPLLRAMRIQVSDGTVRLTGVVRTLQERNLAEAVVRTLPGVRKVESKIELAPGYRRQVDEGDKRSLGQIAVDAKIRQQLLKRLAKVAGVRLSQLPVEVYCQVAVIGGVVPTRTVADRVYQTAQFCPDVSSVVLHVLVEEEDR
ncbi:MAG TPA: BON domain-containing protein [bacterium]|nr:BON domain-containing protein [bacterium]